MPATPMHRHRLTALGLAALLVAGLSGCARGDASVDQAPESTAALPVIVAPAEIADIHATYKTTATITADAEAPILARVGGEVVEILVEEGDVVRKGQVLARLDGDRLRLEMRQAKAEYDKAAREYSRMADLHARNLISTATFEDLKYDRDAKKASFDLKRLNFGYTSIRATIDGVVSSRDVKLGTNVSTGQTAFKVTDTSRLVAYLNIPQTELSKFSSGDTAMVSVDSAPETRFDATIARISPTIDMKSGTFRATLDIDNSGNELAPGMFARFTIAYEEHENAIVIPFSAVVLEDNESIVYIVENGSAARRTVQTGIHSGDLVEVLTGLAGDEQIVLSGQSRLRDGSRVLASADTGEIAATG